MDNNGSRLRQTGYCIVSCARSRVGECVCDECVLGEGVLWNKVIRSPLTSTAIMMLSMDGTVAEVNLVLVVMILYIAVCRVFVILVAAASFSSSISCSRWLTMSVSDRTKLSGSLVVSLWCSSLVCIALLK